MKSFTAFNEMVSNKKQKEAIENAKLDRKSALKVASKTYKEDTELEEGLKPVSYTHLTLPTKA